MQSGVFFTNGCVQRILERLFILYNIVEVNSHSVMIKKTLANIEHIPYDSPLACRYCYDSNV